jgi:cytochrome c oxidase subunit 4
MGEHAHKLEIFRGLIKFKSNTQKIIGVLLLLSIVTLIEVVLGIYKPAPLNESFLNLKLLNWVFIILTIVKAYYITWDFMHMRDETSVLRRVVVWTSVFLILYLTFILIQEGGYIFDEFNDTSNYIKTDF